MITNTIDYKISGASAEAPPFSFALVLQQGRPAVVVFNGTPYVYVYDVQGDVIALVDSTGAKV